MSIRVVAILVGLLALLFTLACEVEPEITVDDVDVTIDHSADPFAIKSELTPEQKSGDADVLVSFGAITHLAKDGPASRSPGRVIGWMADQVEVVFSKRDGDDYVKVFVSYGDDFDPDDLHDDKANIASCRFIPSTYSNWPVFGECSKVN